MTTDATKKAVDLEMDLSDLPHDHEKLIGEVPHGGKDGPGVPHIDTSKDLSDMNAAPPEPPPPVGPPHWPSFAELFEGATN